MAFRLQPRNKPDIPQRLGVHAAFNSGAITFGGKVFLMTRLEGNDRKSFFAVSESENGIDNFRFRDKPVAMPETDNPGTNVYDMRMTQH